MMTQTVFSLPVFLLSVFFPEIQESLALASVPVSLHFIKREKKAPQRKSSVVGRWARVFPEHIAYLSRQGIDKEGIQDAFVNVELILFLSSGC
jgi:hypothetical protein